MSGMSEASVDRTEAVWGGGQQMTQEGPGGMAKKGRRGLGFRARLFELEPQLCLLLVVSP